MVSPTSTATVGHFHTEADQPHRDADGRPASPAGHNRFPAPWHGSDMADYTTVSIPKDLAERVEETIEGTSFSSTSDLVRFLLRSIVVEHQREGELTEAQFQDITDQLRDLGYLE